MRIKHTTTKTLILLAAALTPLTFGPGASAEAVKPEQKAQRRLINPLLDHIKFKELRPFKAKIQGRIEQAVKRGDIESAAVYFRSLSEGMWFGINERELFSPASIMKVPIMIAYYKAAERDPDILRKKLAYRMDEQDAAEGVAIRSAIPGKLYTAEKLIRVMITESDNSAAAVLAENIPAQDLIGTFEFFGIAITGKDVRDSFDSLKISASLLRVLYNASYLNEKFSEQALEHLTHCTFTDGIRAGVPAEYEVAHKFGARALEGDIKQLHDVAIVYYTGNPYLLSVMTKGTGKDYSGMARLIRDISSVTFEEVSSQHNSGPEDKTVVIE